MKRILTLCLLLLLCVTYSMAKQEPYSDVLNIKGTLKSPYQQIPAGSPVTIRMVMKISGTTQYEAGIYYMTEANGETFMLPQGGLSQIELASPQNTTEFWQQIYLTHHFYEQKIKTSELEEFRREVEEESREYLEHLNDILYEDAYITSYVQGIVARMCGDNITTYRNGNLNVYVIQSPEPSSFMLPSGSLIVSTGLLCALDSEEELTAVLADEISHYLFDHQLNNIRKAERRAQRALFWADVFSATSYALEDAYYYGGNERTLGASALADVGTIISLLCLPVIDRLGMNYSDKQEKEADQLAGEILAFHGYPTDALSSGLKKIRDYYLRNRQTEDILRYHSVDDLQKRIEALPASEGSTSADNANRPYLKNTYDAVNFNAALNYAGGLFKESIMLAEKNIKNRLADAQTYVLLVQSKMALYNTPEANEECLALLEEADKLAPNAPNLDVCKQRILLLMRMKKQSDALHSLQDYVDVLHAYQEQRPADREERIWIDKEMNWALMLMEKINKV